MRALRELIIAMCSDDRYNADSLTFCSYNARFDNVCFG